MFNRSGSQHARRQPSVAVWLHRLKTNGGKQTWNCDIRAAYNRSIDVMAQMLSLPRTTFPKRKQRIIVMRARDPRLCHRRTSYFPVLAIIGAAAFVVARAPATTADEFRSPVEAPRSSRSVADVAMTVTDLILQHHIDPPTRQQMLLMGLKAALKRDGQSASQSLSRKISTLADDELVAFIDEAAAESSLPLEHFEAYLLDGIASSVFAAKIIASDELKVEEQLKSNRYVGVGIALAHDGDRGLPSITMVFPKGPAHGAGARDQDLILEVDGTDTHKMPLAEVVQLLRGPEGTAVTIVVRQPEADESRTLEMARGVVPINTITKSGTYKIGGAVPVSYVQIGTLRSSTLHELRQAEQEMREEGTQAVILDLRNANGGRHHDSLLVADALLDGGIIGRVGTSAGSREYAAQPECLFKDWPMAVMVNGDTSGGAEWIAAALQDNGRAIVFGQPSAGAGYVEESFPIRGRNASLQLVTGTLQRADGTSLVTGIPREQLRIPRSSAAALDRARVRVVPDNPAGDGKQETTMRRVVKHLRKILEESE